MGEKIPYERPREKIEKLEDNTPYLVVEIGFGKDPLPATMGSADPYRKYLRDNADIHYFGLEKDPDRFAQGRGKQEMADQVRHFDKDERLTLLNQSGEQLPFQENCVAEVVMRDVLSDTDIPRAEKIKMVREAARVLRPGGILRVIERISPLPQENIRFLIESADVPPEEAESISNESTSLDMKMLEPMRYPAAYVLYFRKREKNVWNDALAALGSDIGRQGRLAEERRAETHNPYNEESEDIGRRGDSGDELPEKP